MPQRIVREEILTSEAVNSLSFEAEVFYRRLMSKADDLGLYDARPRTLCSELYAYKKGVEDEHCAAWLEECVQAGLVRLYEVEGRAFLFIEKFGQKLRNMKPKHPLPEWIEKQEEIVDGKKHVTYLCRTCVGHVSYTCRSRAVHMTYTCSTCVGHVQDMCRTCVGHVSAEEKRKEEKGRETNNKVVDSTTLSTVGSAEKKATPPLSASPPILPEGFLPWLGELGQAHPSLRQSVKLHPNVQAAAISAFERCPKASDKAALLTAFFADRLQSDSRGRAFYRPSGQAKFFENLEDTIASAEKWDRETGWSRKRATKASGNASISHRMPSSCPRSPSPAVPARTEEQARLLGEIKSLVQESHFNLDKNPN